MERWPALHRTVIGTVGPCTHACACLGHAGLRQTSWNAVVPPEARLTRRLVTCPPPPVTVTALRPASSTTQYGTPRCMDTYCTRDWWRWLHVCAAPVGCLAISRVIPVSSWHCSLLTFYRGSHFTEKLVETHADYLVVVYDALLPCTTLRNLSQIWDAPNFRFIQVSAVP